MKEPKHKVPDAWQLNAELDGIGHIIVGLYNQMDAESCDHLTESSMKEALYAVQKYVFRVSEDWRQYAEEMEEMATARLLMIDRLQKELATIKERGVKVAS